MHGSRSSLLLLVLAACAAEERECAADVDCGTGFSCTEGGTCLRDPLGGGGHGGDAPVVDACDASDDCLAAPFALVPDVYWDGSPQGELLCAVPLRNCPAGECEVARECAPLQPDATTPGLLRCVADADCWTGRCLEREGVRFCLRSCTEDTDCPLNDETGGAAVGFVCARLVDRGVPLQSCVPIDPAAPGRTLCRNDCDCGSPGGCTPEEGLACRFVGWNLPRLHAVPVCEPLPPTGPDRPAGARCRADPLSCHGGACGLTCSMSGHVKALHCEEPRCTQPCDRDGDCPDRLSCTSGTETERVGRWHAVGADTPDDDGRNITYCLLPDDGCMDEIDCCPRSDGAGGCLDGWSASRRRCSVISSGPPASARLLTICAELDPARTPPGSCCASHDACDSALCVPARDGTPCAGGGVCSVPCDADPDAGVDPGTSPARDRCAAADFGANDYHRASTCQLFDYVVPSTGRVVQLRACR